MKPIRILIADNCPLVREGVQAALTSEPYIECVGVAINIDELSQCCFELKPDLLIIDLYLSELDPYEISTKLRCQQPALKILVFSSGHQDIPVSDILAMGASGFVLKDEMPDVLLRAVKCVLSGDYWFSKDFVHQITQIEERNFNPNKKRHLTRRETEVFRLLEQGKTDKEIANELSLSKSTVRSHIQKIFEKLGCRNRTEAVFRGKM